VHDEPSLSKNRLTATQRGARVEPLTGWNAPIFKTQVVDRIGRNLQKLAVTTRINETSYALYQPAAATVQPACISDALDSYCGIIVSRFNSAAITQAACRTWRQFPGIHNVIMVQCL
jgi:hypothetical protein